MACAMHSRETMRWLSSSVATLLLTGCASTAGSSDGATSSEALATASFSAVLQCDDGAAVLDVAKEKTEVLVVDEAGSHTRADHAMQFVIRDRDLVSRMSAAVPHIVAASGEIILRGQIEDGAPFDFFEDWSMGQADVRPEGNKVRVREQVGAVVHRVHGEADKVRVVFNRTRFTDTCATYFDEVHCAPKGGQRVDIQTTRQDTPIVDAVLHCIAPR